MLQTEPSYVALANYHIVAEVNPDATADAVELNLELDGGASVVGRVVDADGQPLNGYYYAGQSAQLANWMWAIEDEFELKAYDPASPRHVYFCDQQRDLAGRMILSGEVTETPVVKLQHAGTVKGRLIDDDGAPLSNVQLMPWYPITRPPRTCRATTLRLFRAICRTRSTDATKPTPRDDSRLRASCPA